MRILVNSDAKSDEEVRLLLRASASIQMIISKMVRKEMRMDLNIIDLLYSADLNKTS